MGRGPPEPAGKESAAGAATPGRDRGRWLGQRPDERGGWVGEGRRGGPATAASGRGRRADEGPGLRGNRGGGCENGESGPRQGGGAGRPGRRAPERRVNGGSTVRAEVAGSGSRPRPDGARVRCSPGSGPARSGGRAGQGVPRPEGPHTRGSMPGTAAPEVAGAGDSSRGGHGGAGGSGPFDPEVELPRRRPTIGPRSGGTKGPAALGGDAPVRLRRPEAWNFPGAASSGAGRDAEERYPRAIWYHPARPHNT